MQILKMMTALVFLLWCIYFAIMLALATWFHLQTHQPDKKFVKHTVQCLMNRKPNLYCDFKLHIHRSNARVIIRLLTNT